MLVVGLCTAGMVRAQPHIDCLAGVTEAECALVHEVAGRLLAAATPVPGYTWPPHIIVKDDDTVNAFAWSGPYETYAQLVEQEGVTPLPAAGDQGRTVMIFTSSILRLIVEGDPNRLGLVMGHEMGHLLHEHSKEGRVLAREDATTFVDQAYGREAELEADLEGMKLALAAGYSYDRITRAFRRMIERGINTYNSFHALNVSHPSWKERLAHIDARQSDLWSAMSAFDNGVLFLLVENYPAAERAFRNVTREFPGAYEAWANLGYALLMQYCDALDPDDVRRFGIGHLLVGGFYRRPASLEAQVRGVDEELWWDAVGALKEALRLNPDLTLAKANLGVAYLLRPAGKDVGQATRYLQDAADIVAADTTLDPVMRAAVLINAGVAEMAGGDVMTGAARFDRAETYGQALRGRRRVPAVVSTALLYNRAMLLSGTSGREAEAVPLLEQYLRRASAASAWWELAYERYAALCAMTGVTARSEKALRRRANPSLRTVTSVEFPGGGGVTLAEPMDDVTERLGTGQRIPVAGRSRLSRVYYADRGVELVVTDEVLAVSLKGPNAPSLPLRGAGLGAETVVTLHVGMSRDELDEALELEDYIPGKFIDPNVNYRFYRDLGLAIRVKGGVVREIVVVQIPEKRTMP